ncbi:MAG: hypothetical protein ABEJ74_03000 [Haloferacaceae archaeon]
MTGSDDDLIGRLRNDFDGFSRYDFQLALIPTAFLVSAVGVGATALPARTGLLFAGAVSLLVLADALFVDPPSGPGTGPGAGAP